MDLQGNYASPSHHQCCSIQTVILQNYFVGNITEFYSPGMLKCEACQVWQGTGHHRDDVLRLCKVSSTLPEFTFTVLLLELLSILHVTDFPQGCPMQRFSMVVDEEGSTVPVWNNVCLI
jgi:hypothetical protein